MIARLAGNFCFRCGEPVFVGRYSSGGSSLCAECEQQARAEEAERLREPKEDDQTNESE